MFVVVERITAS